jgi:hypothetical protein
MKVQGIPDSYYFFQYPFLIFKKCPKTFGFHPEYRYFADGLKTLITLNT